MTQQSNDQGKRVTPSSRPMSEQDQGMVDQGMFGQGPQPSGQRITGQQTGGSGQSGTSGQGLSDQLQGAASQVQDTLQNITQGDFSLQNLVSERPWMAIGAAVAAGYVLGSMAGGDDADAAYSTLSTRDYPNITYSNPVPPMYPSSTYSADMPSSYPGSAYAAGTPPSYSGSTYSASMPSSYSGSASTAGTPPSYSGSASSPGMPSSYPGSTSSSRSSSRSQGPSFFDQLDDEIDMLKTAAISTVRSLLRENLGEYMGKLNIQHQRAAAGRPANMPSAEEYTRERSVGQQPGKGV